MKFSVLMSVYNGEKPNRLSESLESILDQILIPNEIVLVVDGPVNDEIEYVINYYNHRYSEVKVVRLSQNNGLGAALRFGLEHCTYEYVARMDSDDICLRHRFLKQINFLKNNSEISVVGGIIEEFKEAPGDLNRYRHLPENFLAIKKLSKYRNPLNHPTVMFRKSHILEVGSYEDMLYFEDYFLWCKLLLRNYKISNLNDVLLYFRTDEKMINRRRGFQYLKHEYNFFKNLMRIGFINFLEFLVLISVKLPLRMLPKNILSKFYNLFRK